jgi:hypothetical protein
VVVFHWHALEGTSGLGEVPDEVLEVFSKTLAEAQRGEPEHAMLQAQRALGGGVLSYAIEHTGDITHRGWKAFHLRRGLSCDYVHEKTKKVLKTLQHGYGFEREHEENMLASNSDPELVRKRLRAYAEAHSRLPVYNVAQRTARDAAVYLGQQRYHRVEPLLESLVRATEDCDRWYEMATEYTPGSDGLPKRIG